MGTRPSESARFHDRRATNRAPDLADMHRRSGGAADRWPNRARSGRTRGLRCLARSLQ